MVLHGFAMFGLVPGLLAEVMLALIEAKNESTVTGICNCKLDVSWSSDVIAATSLLGS